MISTNTRLVALVGALMVLLFVLEWSGAGAEGGVLAPVGAHRGRADRARRLVRPAVQITDWIGGVAPSSTLFFFGLIFVFTMLLLHSRCG